MNSTPIEQRDPEFVEALQWWLKNRNPWQWILTGGFVYDALKKMFISFPEMTGRSEPCTCGSGKKYKKCCGRA